VNSTIDDVPCPAGHYCPTPDEKFSCEELNNVCVERSDDVQVTWEGKRAEAYFTLSPSGFWTGDALSGVYTRSFCEFGAFCNATSPELVQCIPDAQRYCAPGSIENLNIVCPGGSFCRNTSHIEICGAGY